ncbi:ras-related and estrogen-regulated growth inhibitor [Biomphalaria pfeifferi]|uniref:small monomeric GTPase n=1 Tax=Biomphalaria pfeifferi TaxID=112525 RepID=A0AAD8B3D6_BIOPF|nr:ras-related and estrogen-regulated growth inhibitor [Biomphalaria pfeifferi]
MSAPGSPPEGSSPNSGTTLKPYLRRKKSSLGETKIAVLGMAGVGKSALCVRFLTKRFIGEYDQASENKYKCATTLEGESVTFELLDTRSNNDDMGVRDDVVRWADGFVLVYSVTSRQTFEVLAEVRRRLEDMKKVNHVPVILLGNKADLAHVRQVTQDEGARLAAELSCSFMEVSASEDVTKRLG